MSSLSPSPSSYRALFLRHRRVAARHVECLDADGADDRIARARFFVGEGPEISFGARFANMQTTVIKLLWPYWIADKPRRMGARKHLRRTVTEGSCRSSFRWRMSVEPRPLHLDANEMQISFDIVNADDVTGDSRRCATQMRFRARRAKVTSIIKSGDLLIPIGRSVRSEGGELVLGEFYNQALMADFKIAVAGARISSPNCLVPPDQRLEARRFRGPTSRDSV